MKVDYHKNREREKATFANINLLGKCNADCFFCLGKDIDDYLRGKNQLSEHFSNWKNFERFLYHIQAENIVKVYITGQTADGLQYKYLSELVDYLQNDWDFHVGLRSNGYLALQKMKTINQMKDEIGYSIHSLIPEINQKIMGLSKIPDWKNIIEQSGKNVRVSIVVNRYNFFEVESIIKFLSQFNNVKYIQLRRISTDTRLQEFEKDISLYEDLFSACDKLLPRIDDFYLAQRYIWHNKEVNFWRTVETSCNSWNYFTDGTISDEYFIVEGYIKNQII